MDFIDKKIEEYARAHSNEQNEVLKKNERETFAKVLMPRMLSGHLQGEVLKMVSCMIQPQYVLELGTYTGYSALCLAHGLKAGGKLITIDKNEELESFVARFISEAGMQEKIECRIGNALDIIPSLEQTFDLIFIDADKLNYDNYYELCLPKLRKGGFILLDNVLWSGKVVENKMDKDTLAIDTLNKKIKNDTRVEKVLLPIRDGIMIVRKC